MEYKKIAFAGPWITQKEIDYVIDATRNGFYETYDLHTKKLEKAVAEYLGVKYTIATHCCTLALHLAAVALDLGPEDEVIVTDFSWVATSYAIAYTGAKCVFVDIDPDTWCIDPKAIEAAITSKTKAIMLVHSFGQPAQMDKIMTIAQKNNLRVIEDAAPALGAEFRGQKVGTFGDVGCFSFQGAKLTVSGEGGIFVTNDESLYERAKLLSSMGRTDSKAVFWSDVIGYQYTIANLTAALALAQVERVEELMANKRQIFNWYYDRLKNVPGIKIIKEKEGCKSNYCYPSILLEDSIQINRDLVLQKLKDVNVHCRPGFPQMSRFPVFEQRFTNPVAKNVEERGISLASASNLIEEDIDFVCKKLIEFVK
jgi:perosamine synthetase